MFERYTEKSRRVIFFSRYEASQYGSRYIETEHLLLGLLREGPLKKWFPGEVNVEHEIRTEIEKLITRRDRISVSVEIPLSKECTGVLNLAGETCERLGHKMIEPEHLLIAILRVEDSLAARILLGRGLKAATFEEKLNNAISQRQQYEAVALARMTLDSFLYGFTFFNAEKLMEFFGSNAVVVDALGNRWDREELQKGFEAVFAFCAKRKAIYEIEEGFASSRDSFSAIVLWKNAFLVSEERDWMHRMSVILVWEHTGWKIHLIQVTPVKPK